VALFPFLPVCRLPFPAVLLFRSAGHLLLLSVLLLRLYVFSLGGPPSLTSHSFYPSPVSPVIFDVFSECNPCYFEHIRLPLFGRVFVPSPCSIPPFLIVSRLDSPARFMSRRFRKKERPPMSKSAACNPLVTGRASFSALTLKKSPAREKGPSGTTRHFFPLRSLVVERLPQLSPSEFLSFS